MKIEPAELIEKIEAVYDIGKVSTMDFDTVVREFDLVYQKYRELKDHWRTALHDPAISGDRYYAALATDNLKTTTRIIGAFEAAMTCLKNARIAALLEKDGR